MSRNVRRVLVVLFHRWLLHQQLAVPELLDPVVRVAPEKLPISFSVDLNQWGSTLARILKLVRKDSSKGSFTSLVGNPKCSLNSFILNSCTFLCTCMGFPPILDSISSPLVKSKHNSESLYPSWLRSLMLADPQMAIRSSMIISLE